jgi:hypothetical protein
MNVGNGNGNGGDCDANRDLLSTDFGPVESPPVAGISALNTASASPPDE